MRIRTIKPGFWQDESLAALPAATRLLAIALLNYADDEGYFMANPALVRGAVFPFDDDSSSVRRGLDELSHAGFIRLGVDTEGRAVGQVVNFQKHQKIDRPQPSRIKETSGFGKTSPRPRRILADTSLPEVEGEKEEEREQGTPPARPATPVAVPPVAAPAFAGKVEAKSPDGFPPPPFGAPAFAEAWAGFVASRRAAKKAVTPYAAKLLFAKLAPWGEPKAIRALNASTENGWQGVFDPDLNNRNATGTRRTVQPLTQSDHENGF